MTTTNQKTPAPRSVTMTLALSMVVALSVPFLLLPRVPTANAAIACTENNRNGCTELSATPPEDTVAVPPNIVLMFDDSGSMKWNYMPDLDYLYNKTNNDALTNAANNGVYYDPTVTYLPPPKANRSSYPSQTNLSSLPIDGFGALTTTKTSLYTYTGNLEWYANSLNNNTQGSKIAFNVTKTLSPQVDKQYSQTVNATYQCTRWDWYGRCTRYGAMTATAEQVCAAKYSEYAGTGGYVFTGTSTSGTCKFTYKGSGSSQTYRFFRYSLGPAEGPYEVHYVAPAAQGCGPQTNCVTDDDTSGVAAPEGVTVAENVGNWFSYYHTRVLMAKSGLMTALDKLNPKYRFGFSSINANNKSDIPNSPVPYRVFNNYSSFRNNAGETISMGSTTNRLAVVQPFGDAQIPNPGSPGAVMDNTGSQRYKFWTWLQNLAPSGSTPLRTSLESMGEYYQTEQPWTAMQGDPGYVTGSSMKYACRSSYTILTTDGLWNDSDKDLNVSGNDDNTTGDTYTPPAGDGYTVTGYAVAAPFADSYSNTLADIAMRFWKKDLRSEIPNQVQTTNNDKAFWQHMTTFTMGMGFQAYSKYTSTTKTLIPINRVFDWARGGPAVPGFQWPEPDGAIDYHSGSIYNLADLVHAAVNGHGGYISAKNPQDLVASFGNALADINARTVPPSPTAVNASVLTVGSIAFETGYSTGDWSGALNVVTLNTDGTVGAGVWPMDPDDRLTLDYHSATGYTARKVYSLSYDSTRTTPIASFQFTAGNASQLDASQVGALNDPALSGGDDTLAHRINFLLGDSTYEGTVYRSRAGLLGAIIRSEPLYVAAATGHYYASWPSFGGVAPPEKATDAQKYDSFAETAASRQEVIYVGANDGMLHTFNAPPPQCTSKNADGSCASWDFGTDPGKEIWAFIPRAVYANLGNMLGIGEFAYLPTVDAAPVARDVYFSGDKKWHTLLTGGVGLGGRGVYALDVSNPGTFTAANVLWEFDSDMTVAAGCVTSFGTCKATDLGFTLSKPNVARLANGKWVVLVPNGYFPDCTTPDMPTEDNLSCQTIALDSPVDSGKPYSALFVLDAETGAMLAELKTPTNIDGVSSFGLASPVMGDYNNDQVDDVAFAGDVQGNIWRFDLSGATPGSWSVSLLYQGASLAGKQGQQPVTTMPRLFPDPATNRFMVVFGTGKFFGVGDNSNNTVQSLYGVRDRANTTYSRSDLVAQYLHETIAPAKLPDGTTDNPLAGASLRCITGGAADVCGTPTDINAVPGSKGGWMIDLKTTTSDGTVNNAGERVVVNPGAIFASNTVVFQTLITGAEVSDACSPSTAGSLMAFNALTGGPGGMSMLGSPPIVGARIKNARTNGSLPIVSALGGGQAYLPGVTLAPDGETPLSVDAPIWRRRSWQQVTQ